MRLAIFYLVAIAGAEVGTGFVEGFICRGVMQRASMEAMGGKALRRFNLAASIGMVVKPLLDSFSVITIRAWAS
jgi:hypothetical protein